ncbi:Transposable element P transposase [Aphis craccivora]|uniref:Transposable element P transposase n=1 Tax=Aphis craccivora TaxID=307492 RepID=A0A6G0Y1P3_APHCR|nr:Transposable element P transposase [Aphis craccivora]
MARWLYSNWKLPVAYFFSAFSMSHSVLNKLIISTVEKLLEEGYKHISGINHITSINRIIGIRNLVTTTYLDINAFQLLLLAGMLYKH